jgi:hypothetical protein
MVTELKTKIPQRLWVTYLLRMLLEGVTPLLQHNPRGMAARPERIGRKHVPSPEQEAEAATYRLPDGTLGVPPIAVRNCLVGGATGLKIGRAAATKVLAGAIEPLNDDPFPLIDLEGNPIRTYEIDVRRAVVQSQGVLRARPKIFPWRLSCQLKLTLPSGTDIDRFLEDLSEVVNNAGRYPGLLDGRPQKIKGLGLWFGKFQLLEISAEPIEEAG